LKIALVFEDFGITLVNTQDKFGNGSLISGYNLVTVSDILDECGVEMADIQSTGMMVTGDFTYYCNFDNGNDCDPYPKFRWFREDINEDSVSVGFNFRRVFYSRVINGTTEDNRLLVKYHGIRFRFNILGEGGKFAMEALSTTLGAGIALTAIAAVIAELFLKHCIPERFFYEKKRKEVISQSQEKLWAYQNSENFDDSVRCIMSENLNESVEPVTMEKHANTEIREKTRKIANQPMNPKNSFSFAI